MNASLKALLNEQYRLVAQLREENNRLKNNAMEDMRVQTKLEEENKKLKEYNGELIENHKKDIAILCEENKKLKSDLSECECSFLFENDEVGFWKREYKRLKKWIKDHCKGYGNLFPEDEMKRQRKKADKKRKNKLKGMLMEEDTLQELRDIGEI